MRHLKLAFLPLLFGLTSSSCACQDDIIGVWDVKTDHYRAVYEIVENESKYYGMVHYYNDGTTEYKGNGKEEDYFLTDVEAKEDHYVHGKMYLPDGSYYEVIFNLMDANTLEMQMTVEGLPYRETWKRQYNHD